MTERLYNRNDQQEIKIFATLRDARAEARKHVHTCTVCGCYAMGENEFEVMRALDMYTGSFIGYVVEKR